VANPDVLHQQKAKRLEFRTPDRAASLLCLSGHADGGLDGVKNKNRAAQADRQEFVELEPEEAAKGEIDAGSLDQALDALEKDHDFLLKGDVFTNDVIRHPGWSTREGRGGCHPA